MEILEAVSVREVDEHSNDLGIGSLRVLHGCRSRTVTAHVLRYRIEILSTCRSASDVHPEQTQTSFPCRCSFRFAYQPSRNNKVKL